MRSNPTYHLQLDRALAGAIYTSLTSSFAQGDRSTYGRVRGAAMRTLQWFSSDFNQKKKTAIAKTWTDGKPHSLTIFVSAAWILWRQKLPLFPHEHPAVTTTRKKKKNRIYPLLLSFTKQSLVILGRKQTWNASKLSYTEVISFTLLLFFFFILYGVPEKGSLPKYWLLSIAYFTPVYLTSYFIILWNAELQNKIIHYLQQSTEQQTK